MTKETNAQIQNDINSLFYNINAFKRHRTMLNSARHKNNLTDATYQELKMYQFFDAIELSARSLQKQVREDGMEND